MMRRTRTIEHDGSDKEEEEGIRLDGNTDDYARTGNEEALSSASAAINAYLASVLSD
jgi:hypothetical protein